MHQIQNSGLNQIPVTETQNLLQNNLINVDSSKSDENNQLKSSIHRCLIFSTESNKKHTQENKGQLMNLCTNEKLNPNMNELKSLSQTSCISALSQKSNFEENFNNPKKVKRCGPESKSTDEHLIINQDVAKHNVNNTKSSNIMIKSSEEIEPLLNDEINIMKQITKENEDNVQNKSISHQSLKIQEIPLIKDIKSDTMESLTKSVSVESLIKLPIVIINDTQSEKIDGITKSDKIDCKSQILEKSFNAESASKIERLVENVNVEPFMKLPIVLLKESKSDKINSIMKSDKIDSISQIFLEKPFNAEPSSKIGRSVENVNAESLMKLPIVIINDSKSDKIDSITKSDKIDNISQFILEKSLNAQSSSKIEQSSENVNAESFMKLPIVLLKESISSKIDSITKSDKFDSISQILIEKSCNIEPSSKIPKSIGNCNKSSISQKFDICKDIIFVKDLNYNKFKCENSQNILEICRNVEQLSKKEHLIPIVDEENDPTLRIDSKSYQIQAEISQNLIDNPSNINQYSKKHETSILETTSIENKQSALNQQMSSVSASESNNGYFEEITSLEEDFNEKKISMLEQTEKNHDIIIIRDFQSFKKNYNAMDTNLINQQLSGKNQEIVVKLPSNTNQVDSILEQNTKLFEDTDTFQVSAIKQAKELDQINNIDRPIYTQECKILLSGETQLSEEYHVYNENIEIDTNITLSKNPYSANQTDINPVYTENISNELTRDETMYIINKSEMNQANIIEVAQILTKDRPCNQRPCRQKQAELNKGILNKDRYSNIQPTEEKLSEQKDNKTNEPTTELSVNQNREKYLLHIKQIAANQKLSRTGHCECANKKTILQLIKERFKIKKNIKSDPKYIINESDKAITQRYRENYEKAKICETKVNDDPIKLDIETTKSIKDQQKLTTNKKIITTSMTSASCRSSSSKKNLHTDNKNEPCQHIIGSIFSKKENKEEKIASKIESTGKSSTSTDKKDTIIDKLKLSLSKENSLPPSVIKLESESKLSSKEPINTELSAVQEQEVFDKLKSDSDKSKLNIKESFVSGVNINSTNVDKQDTRSVSDSIESYDKITGKKLNSSSNKFSRTDPTESSSKIPTYKIASKISDSKSNTIKLSPKEELKEKSMEEIVSKTGDSNSKKLTPKVDTSEISLDKIESTITNSKSSLKISNLKLDSNDIVKIASDITTSKSSSKKSISKDESNEKSNDNLSRNINDSKFSSKISSSNEELKEKSIEKILSKTTVSKSSSKKSTLKADSNDKSIDKIASDITNSKSGSKKSTLKVDSNDKSIDKIASYITNSKSGSKKSLSKEESKEKSNDQIASNITDSKSSFKISSSKEELEEKSIEKIVSKTTDSKSSSRKSISKEELMEKSMDIIVSKTTSSKPSFQKSTLRVDSNEKCSDKKACKIPHSKSSSKNSLSKEEFYEKSIEQIASNITDSKSSSKISSSKEELEEKSIEKIISKTTDSKSSSRISSSKEELKEKSLKKIKSKTTDSKSSSTKSISKEELMDKSMDKIVSEAILSKPSSNKSTLKVDSNEKSIDQIASKIPHSKSSSQKSLSKEESNEKSINQIVGNITDSKSNSKISSSKDKKTSNITNSKSSSQKSISKKESKEESIEQIAINITNSKLGSTKSFSKPNSLEKSVIEIKSTITDLKSLSSKKSVTKSKLQENASDDLVSKISNSKTASIKSSKLKSKVNSTEELIAKITDSRSSSKKSLKSKIQLIEKDNRVLSKIKTDSDSGIKDQIISQYSELKESDSKDLKTLNSKQKDGKLEISGIKRVSTKESGNLSDRVNINDRENKNLSIELLINDTKSIASIKSCKSAVSQFSKFDVDPENLSKPKKVKKCRPKIKPPKSTSSDKHIEKE